MIRLKSNVFPDALRDYGFVKVSELANKERAYESVGYGYKADWWVKHLLEDTETGEYVIEPNENTVIAYADEDFDQPMVTISYRPEWNDFYISCVPSGSYEIGGWDLEIIPNTFYRLAVDGLIEDTEV